MYSRHAWWIDPHTVAIVTVSGSSGSLVHTQTLLLWWSSLQWPHPSWHTAAQCPWRWHAHQAQYKSPGRPPNLPSTAAHRTHPLSQMLAYRNAPHLCKLTPSGGGGSAHMKAPHPLSTAAGGTCPWAQCCPPQKHTSNLAHQLSQNHLPIAVDSPAQMQSGSTDTTTSRQYRIDLCVLSGFSYTLSFWA